LTGQANDKCPSMWSRN